MSGKQEKQLRKEPDKSNWIVFKVEPLDKTIKPFFLSSAVMPQLKTTMQYKKKLYMILNIFTDFDSGTITLFVNELIPQSPIATPKIIS